MIGHLQSNKVKYIVPFVHLIHSIDSERLLAEVDKQAAKASRTVKCLLQVHIAREETKFGFSTDELKDFLRSGKCKRYVHVHIAGLMGMATLTDDNAQVSAEFRTLHDAFAELKGETLSPNVTMEILSMGMSGDYSLAVAEGSTMIRVGSAIFGDRT
jgi:pyridoxal phosphate enzyme (YggS family)